MPTRKQKSPRLLAVGVVALVAAIALIAWPARLPDVADAPAGAQQFAWNRDSLWSALETSFARTRAEGCTNEQTARLAADSVSSSMTQDGVS